MKKTANHMRILLFLVCLSGVVLSMPLLFGALYRESSIFGMESYYHLRVSEAIRTGQSLNKDNLIVADRPLLVSPYHYLFAYLPAQFGEDGIAKFLPVLLGVLSVVVLFFVLRNHRMDPDLMLISMIMLIFSPPFIYSFTISTPLCLVLFLTLLGFLCLSSGNRYVQIASMLFFLTIPFFGFIDAAILLVLILLYAIVFKEKRILCSVIIPLCVLILALSNQSRVFSAGVDHFATSNVFKEIIFELGGEFGFGFFILLLALVGLLLNIRLSRKYILFNGVFIGLVVFSLYFNHAFFYLNFVLCLFAASAFDRLLKRKWQMPLVKSATLFVVLLGILFSTISFINHTSGQGPDQKIIESLVFLKGKEGNMLSHYSYGFWIQYYSRNPVLMDGLFKGYDYNKYNFDSNSIYYSRNIETTKSLLNKYRIRYIWIHSDMKKGLVWENENQGLLFLLKNSDAFRKIYDNGEVEIWAYNVPIVEAKNELVY